MPTPASQPITDADIQWPTDSGKPTQNLVISGPGIYVSNMRRIRNAPIFSLISDWMLTDPTDPTSDRMVSSDIAGTLIMQVANIGIYENKPRGNLSWVPLPDTEFNLQTDGYPYLTLYRDAAFNYMQLVLNITQGTGTFFSQFSDVEG